MRYLLGRAGIILFGVAVMIASRARAQPLDTTFTYQGTLSSSGVPVTGTCDLRFKLSGALAGEPPPPSPPPPRTRPTSPPSCRKSPPNTTASWPRTRTCGPGSIAWNGC